jgi:hypothetical protein
MTRCVLVALALAPAGCAKAPPEVVPVEGVVYLNGQPLPHAEVQFVPTAPGLGAEFVSVGVTDERGRFALACGGRAGACAGDNRVTVNEAPAPDEARGTSADAQTRTSRYFTALKNRPIPLAYATVGKTPLVVAVAAGKTEYRLELTR